MKVQKALGISDYKWLENYDNKGLNHGAMTGGQATLLGLRMLQVRSI